MKGGPLHSILLCFSLPWQPLMNVHAIRLSLCLLIVEEWRGPALGVWKKQGELRPFPAWLWNLSAGERRPTGPLLHWSPHKQWAKSGRAMLIFKHRWDLLDFTLSPLSSVSQPQHYFTSTAGQLSNWKAAEPLSVYLYESNLKLQPITKSKASTVRVSMTNQHCPSLRATQIQDVWFVWLAKSVFALSAGLCGLTQQGGAEGCSLQSCVFRLAKGLLVASFGTNLEQAFSECHLDYLQKPAHAQI